MNRLFILSLLAGSNKNMLSLLNNCGINMSIATFSRRMKGEGNDMTDKELVLFRQAIEAGGVPFADDFVRRLQEAYYLISSLIVEGVIPYEEDRMPGWLKEDEEDIQNIKNDEPFEQVELEDESLLGESENEEPFEQVELGNESLLGESDNEDLLDDDDYLEDDENYLDDLLGGGEEKKPAKAITDDGFEKGYVDFPDTFDKDTTKI